MVSRVATFAQTTRLVAATMSVQARLADVQEQQASGLKAASYGQLGGQSGRMLSVSARSAALEAENKALDRATIQLNAAYDAVGSVSSLATTIRGQLASAISGSGDVATVAGSAANWLADLESVLNAQSAGSYLFSGTATDQPAVDFDAMAGAVDATVADASYYHGAGRAQSFTGADGQNVALSATASDPSFEKLVRALRVLSQATTTSEVSTAYDLVTEAIDGLGTLQQTLSVNANSLSDRSERNETEIALLEEIGSQINGADLSSAAVMVVQYQTQIEALYSTISRLSALSLSSYL